MRILIVDDDKLVTESLKTILESDADIDVAGTCNSGCDAVELYFKLKPDVLLLDIRMNGMTGIDAAEKILEKDRDAKILFLTTFSDDEYIVRAFQIGAKGYILKQDFESIIPSVKAVFMGQRVFGDEIISKLPVLSGEKNKKSINDYNLSKREIEIIEHVANGLSNREISNRLFLSEGTVRNYISIILEKLKLRDRTQLAVFYYKTKDDLFS
ncbi:MAG: response regulator transcription factor [Clostridiaceae bacterium]|nr:response regulator transcription factor [Clostridiaceae bacterium]